MNAVPPPPRIPSPRARRLIFGYQGRTLILLLLGLVFTGVGGLQALLLDRRLPAELALTFGSHPSTGHVVDRALERGARRNGAPTTLLTFTYDEAGRQRSSVSSTNDPHLIDLAQPGSDVPIEVANSNPGWARITGARLSLLGLWGLPILLMPSLGLLFLLLTLRARRRAIRAFTIGQPATARVTFAGPDKRTRINGRHPLLVRWEFSIEGKLFKGSVSSMKPPLMEPLMHSTELVVLYDPDNPRINTVYLE